MISGRAYFPAQGIFPFGGLNTLVPPTQLDPRYSPTFDNLTTTKGVVAKRKGYTDLGGSLGGIVLALIRFVRGDGVEFLVAVTTTKQYVWDDTLSRWDDISTTSTWAPTESNLVDWTSATGQPVEGDPLETWLVITNGVDHPIWWDGYETTFQDITLHPEWEYDNFITARSVKMFYNHLVWIAPTTDSENLFDVNWGDAYSLTKFNSGSANAASLTDIRGPLQKGEVLGDRLILYGENAISTMSYVGGDAIYLFEQILTDVRVASARSVINVGPFHIYTSQENIRLFDGTRLSPDIATSIFPSFRADFNPSLKHRCWGFVDVGKNALMVGVPHEEGSTVVYYGEYEGNDLSSLRWSRHTFTGSRRPTCAAHVVRDTTLTWDSPELVGKTWADLNISWDQASMLKGFPIPVVGFYDSTLQQSYVAKVDDFAVRDGGGVVEGVYETPDFVVPQDFLSVNASWMEVECVMRGSEVGLYYSLDEGHSWVVVANPLVLTGTFERQRLDIRAHGRTFRMRVVCGGVNWFELRWLRGWFRPGSPV